MSSYLKRLIRDMNVDMERKCHTCTNIGVWSCLGCKESGSAFTRGVFEELGIGRI